MNAIKVPKKNLLKEKRKKMALIIVLLLLEQWRRLIFKLRKTHRLTSSIAKLLAIFNRTSQHKWSIHGVISYSALARKIIMTRSTGPS